MSKKKTREPGFDPADYEDDLHEIGYGKPPLHSRWQQGQSGNPGGRKKGSLNLQTMAKLLAEELAVLVPVKGSDGKQKVCKQRAYFKTLINEGITGSARDRRILLDAMFKLADFQVAAEQGAIGVAIPGGADALERHIKRAVRRAKLEGDTSAEDDGSGEDLP